MRRCRTMCRFTMTMINDLIGTRNPEAQVFLMTTRKQPFENQLFGVVGREEMSDQRWRADPGIGTDDVFLVVGPRIRPGSLSAWIVVERRAVARSRGSRPPRVTSSVDGGGARGHRLGAFSRGLT